MRLSTALIALVVAAVLSPGFARADSVTVAVAPDSVVLTSGERAVVHVLIVNGTPGPIEQTHMRALAAGSSGITVRPRTWSRVRFPRERQPAHS